MTAEHIPLFEIDQPETYGEFLLRNRNEVIAYLRNLEKQHALITIYIDGGRTFFLSSIIAVDEAKDCIFLDLANSEEIRRLTEQSPQLTLTATLDKVKIQIRVLNQLQEQLDDRAVLAVPLPKTMLRLQRREHFRLETPQTNPLHCKLVRQREDGSTQRFNLTLLDISGGGISLMANVVQSDEFLPGRIFPDGRLEIPGEGFIPINLCVKKTSREENRNGQAFLRIGCEFLSLPGARLAQIQRYISRIERERKVRNAG